MELWQLYLLSILDSIDGTATFLAVIATLTVIGSLVGWAIAHTDELNISIKNAIKKILFWSSVIAITTMFIATAVPSSKNAWIMAGAYVATNVEGVKELPPNVLKALNRFLEQYVEEGK